MRMDLRKWSMYFAIATFAAMFLCVRNAVGQSGACCVSTQQIVIHCQTCDKSGCSCTGQVTIVACSGGYGDGTLYQTKTMGSAAAIPARFKAPVAVATSERQWPHWPSEHAGCSSATFAGGSDSSALPGERACVKRT